MDKGCAVAVKRELEYWMIDELLLQPCCSIKHYSNIDKCKNEIEGDKEHQRREEELAREEDFGDTHYGRFRSWAWRTLEYPWSSKFAKIVAIISLGLVLLSTATFVISTLDEVQENDEGFVEFPVLARAVNEIDRIVVIIFTVEYFFRLIISPRKVKFIRQPMNVFDLVAIVPFYISLVLEELEDFKIIGKTGKIIRLVRVMRFLRIFKLVRHFAGLQALLYTLQQAYRELGMLILLVAVALTTFARYYIGVESLITRSNKCRKKRTTCHM